jgi:hypothetical protein
MIGNRVLLKWKEPRYVLQQIKKQTSWKDWSLIFGKLVGKCALGGLVVGVIIEIISSIRLGFNNVDHFINLSLFTAFGVVFGILAALISIVDLRAAPEVSIREKDIMIMTVNGEATISYKEIQSCSIVNNKVEEKEYCILEIKEWNGNTDFIEIDSNIKIEDITEILKSKNIQVKPSILKLV